MSVAIRKGLEIMNLPRSLRAPLVFVAAALTALIITGASAVDSAAAVARSTSHAPTADTENGSVRGLAVPGAYAFMAARYRRKGTTA